MNNKRKSKIFWILVLKNEIDGSTCVFFQNAIFTSTNIFPRFYQNVGNIWCRGLVTFFIFSIPRLNLIPRRGGSEKNLCKKVLFLNHFLTYCRGSGVEVLAIFQTSEIRRRDFAFAFVFNSCIWYSALHMHQYQSYTEVPDKWCTRQYYEK